VSATGRVAASLILILGIALLAGACTATNPTTTSPSASPSPSARTATPEPVLTPVPGSSAAVASATASALPPTSTTEFGEIWDALPPSFPALAFAIPTTVQGPTSGAFAVGADVATASDTLAAALRASGWMVDVGSPLEDGSVVLDATGPAPGCEARVQFTPLSGTVTMSVLYGAACPFS
jgi:hypothetical protein